MHCALRASAAGAGQVSSDNWSVCCIALPRTALQYNSCSTSRPAAPPTVSLMSSMALNAMVHTRGKEGASSGHLGGSWSVGWLVGSERLKGGKHMPWSKGATVGVQGGGVVKVEATRDLRPPATVGHRAGLWRRWDSNSSR